MRPALTRREKEIYDFVVDFIREERRSPSVSEIAAALAATRKSGKLSLPTVSETLDRLEEKGYIVHGRFGGFGYLIAPAEGDPIDYTYVVGRLRPSGSVREVRPRGFTFKLDVPRSEDVFFLIAAEPIPALAILEGDLLVFEHGRPVAPRDVVLYAVKGIEPAPLYHVACHIAVADRAFLEEMKGRRGVDLASVLDQGIHRPADLPRVAASEGPEGGYLVAGITAEAEASPEHAHFLELARAHPDRVQVVAVQIGLLRLVSHWQRDMRVAPV